jgi:PKD repeat protein
VLPVADFSSDKRQVNVGDTIRFTYESTNYDKLSWDFGDGTFSEEKNPTHIYNTADVFYITFKVIKGTDTVVNDNLKILVSSSKEASIRRDSTAVAKEVPVKKDSVVKAAAPTIVITPVTVYTGDKISYKTNADKPVTIDLGGKSTSEAKAGEVVFDEVGQYVIKLTDKASGTLLDKKTVNVLEKIDDTRLSAWLTDLSNDKLSRSEKTALSKKIYGYCLNNGEIPMTGKETGLFKEFVTKIIFEANPYDKGTVVVTLQMNANKKISSVQLVTYERKAI